MKVHTTAAIRETLLQAAGDASLPEVIRSLSLKPSRGFIQNAFQLALFIADYMQDIKILAKEGAGEPAIEWDALKSIVAAVNAQQGNDTLYLHQASLLLQHLVKLRYILVTSLNLKPSY